jgi:pre-rRNA-processing protein RIX1
VKIVFWSVDQYSNKLQKPDSAAAKKLCILTLTKIYLMTHQYQTLVREITTPTLPSFVSSCLGLVSPGRGLDAPPSLIETVFDSFSALISRHPAIFRPSAHSIRTLTRQYLAPTLSDRRLTPLSLSRSAHRLTVLIYQTTAKNLGGEEWGKGVRELVKEIHGTTDQVYRAVIEDWESATGYVSQPADVGEVLSGGGKSDNDLPTWTGIESGMERVVGLLGLLEEHFKHPTATAVTIPLGLIVDLLTRLLSVASPVNQKSLSDFGAVRLHPGVERNEREGLWCSLPSVHVAALKVYTTLADRLQDNLTSIASSTLDQVTWVFTADCHEDTFRTNAYRLVSKLLPLIGLSLSKPSVAALIPVLHSCATEFQPRAESQLTPVSTMELTGKLDASVAGLDSLRKDRTVLGRSEAEAFDAASELLPLLLSHITQQHLREEHRAELDSAAIISGNKEAMVASVLNPYVRKNGGTFPSILPHLCRAFPGDETVETLLRPRAPIIRSNIFSGGAGSVTGDEKEEDIMEGIIIDDSHHGDGVAVISPEISQRIEEDEPTTKRQKKDDLWGQDTRVQAIDPGETINTSPHQSGQTTNSELSLPLESKPSQIPVSEEPYRTTQTVPEIQQRMPQAEEEDSDDDESVHLNGELSESEDEMVE